VNATQFPLYQEAKVLSVELSPGKCLFVPAFYWSQSRTANEDPHATTTLVHLEYEAHSELLNLLFEAIDQGVLDS
jgi:hypothetical protein